MTIDWDALEAADTCECGTPLAEHPDLPPPKPWGHGRYARVEYQVRGPRGKYQVKAKWAQAANVRS